MEKHTTVGVHIETGSHNKVAEHEHEAFEVIALALLQKQKRKTGALRERGDGLASKKALT